MATPLPTPDFDSAPFWAGCKAGYLSAQRCLACSRYRWPPAEYCPFCHHHGGDWTPLADTGEIRSFVVVHRAFDPAFADKVPYVVAQIAIDGAAGVTMTGNVLVDPVGAVTVGQRVTVEFRDEGTIAMPQFRPI